MVNLNKTVPQISVILAFLTLWTSFAWGLPAEAPANEAELAELMEDPWWAIPSEAAPAAEAEEGEGAPAPEYVWAGARISDAYDYAKCPQCGKKNEIRAETCARCGYELPQPSGEYTYPPWVFVPGKGYYEEGTLLEPGRPNKTILTVGWIITGVCLTAAVVGISAGGLLGGVVAFYSAVPLILVGLPLLVYGLVTRKGPVYAFETGDQFGPYKRTAFALRPDDTDAVAFKVEVTALSF